MDELINLEWNESPCNRPLTIKATQNAAYALLRVLNKFIFFCAKVYLRLDHLFFTAFKLFKRFLQVVTSLINVHLLLVVL